MSQHFLEVFLHVAFSNQWISYLGCRFRVEVEVESKTVLMTLKLCTYLRTLYQRRSINKRIKDTIAFKVLLLSSEAVRKESCLHLQTIKQNMCTRTIKTKNTHTT